VEAGGAEAGEVGGGVDAAFGDFHDAGRNAGGEVERGLQRDLEGVQVAVVDADEVASSGESAVEFSGVVDFDEDVKLQFAGAAVERSEIGVGESGDDEEDGVGAMDAGFEELKLVDDEVFAQAGNLHRLRGEFEIAQRALEELLVGEDREAGGSGGFEFGGERGDVEVGANQALGG